MASPGASAAILLAKQLKRMQKEDHIDGISVGLADNDNVFEWEVMLMLSDDIPFYGGLFRTNETCEISWLIFFRRVLQGETEFPKRLSVNATKIEV
jgi:ubiquitin-protein ligase